MHIFEESELLEFHGRLKKAIEFRQRNMSWLASQIGLTRAGMLYLTTKATKPNYVSQIAEALEINPIWLATGKGNILLDANGSLSPHSIPLLNFTSILNSYEKKLYHSKKNLLVEDKMETCFATLYPLDNINQEIKKNSLVIIDWNKNRVDIGLFLILSKKDQHLYIKQKLDKDNPYFTDSMQAIMITDDCIIIGKVVEIRTYLT